MLHKVASLRDFGRKVSPPQPTFMTDDQKADYLASLRNDRPVRPGGSRPPPFKSSTYSSPKLARSKSRPEINVAAEGIDLDSEKQKEDDIRHSNRVSFAPREMPGRPLVQAPTAHSVRGRKVSPTATIESASAEDPAYRESGTRWLERQEAHSLREALETMDARKEEKRIHSAARNEAAELVWRHRNPKAAEVEKVAAYKNPDLFPKNRFKAHLEKGAHVRSQKQANLSSANRLPKSESSRSASDSSNYSNNSADLPREASMSKNDRLSDAPLDLKIAAVENPRVAPLARGIERRKSSGQRVLSNGSSKGVGVFRNPEDQIYEEPEVSQTTLPNQADGHEEIGPLKAKHRNSLPRGSRPLPQKSNTAPLTMKQRVDRFEIFKNPPSQSRNAAYTVNPATPPPAIPEVDTPPSKGGIEIRSEDIRAATSMKKKDRSPNLPTPTAVSDRAGRPIVSFDPAWTPTQQKDEPEAKPARPSPSIPVLTVSAPAVPTINLPSDDTPCAVPTINFPDDDLAPTITFYEPTSTPKIKISNNTAPNQRPLPHHSQSCPPNPTTKPNPSRLAWPNSTPRSGTPTVTCTSCTLPISGRIVTASGSNSSPSAPKARFHPECFTCHHCSTSLECVAFYPEPEAKRAERLLAANLAADSPDDLRFYCHLDFHEFFSPRCRNCHTPIEGEVILAAGHAWHAGHFFCAECGDPFASDTPFVEHGGYAYCVSCHTKRTSARCRACKRQILDEMTVEALGGTWHEACFACLECAGGFGEEGRFFVREVEVEATEKERRRGVTVKFEERAVCEGCEGRRLKA